MVFIEVKSSSEYYSLIQNPRYKLKVVMFTSPSCGPCAQIKPYFIQMANQHQMIAFILVNVYVCTDLTRLVRGLPTFHFYADGRKIHELVGANQQNLSSSIAYIANMK
jgi:thiol-disulfide isomerase/thioredoxin